MKHLVFIAIAIIFTLPSHAADPIPMPERKQLSLQNLKSAVEHEKEQQKKLQSNIAETEKSLKDLRNKLVKTAKEEREISKSLQSLEKRQDTLIIQERILTDKLAQNKDKISFLVTALSRMQLKPNASYLFAEDAHEKQILINASFKHMMPDMLADTKAIVNDLEKLSDVKQALAEKEQQIDIQKKKLSGNHTELESLIKKRKNLYQENKDKLNASKKQAAAFAAQAKTMEELLAKLQTAKPKLSRKPQYTETLPQRGGKRLPVAGTIKVGYGTRNDIGATSQGIEISTRKGATAIAPMGGRVRYIGSFKQYKNLMIIEHKDDYHSLISGLENISVELGQSVLAGEPLGVIGDGQNGTAVLYYELRYKGRPIDPVK